MTALSFNVMPCLLRADPPKILNLEKISHKNKQTKKISSNAGFFICVHEIKKSFKNDRKNTEQPLEIKYLSGSMKIYHIKRSAPNT